MGWFGRRAEQRISAQRPPRQDLWNAPVRLERVGGFQKLVVSGSTVFAVRVDGSLYSWRPPSQLYPSPWVLGQGDSPLPLQLGRVDGISGVRDVVIGTYDTYALGAGGDVFAWGSSGVPSTPGGATNRPRRVPELTDVRRLYRGTTARHAVTGSGSVYAWGQNEYGQLGLGDREDRVRPEPVPELQRVEEFFEVGLNEGTALFASTTDSQLFEWGTYLPSRGRETTPTLVPGIPGAKKLMPFEGGVIAVGTDDVLYRWGPDLQGGFTGFGEPAKRLGVTAVRQITAVSRVAYAVDGDGAVWAWGEKAHQVLGLDGEISVTSPTRIAGLENVARLTPSEGTMHAVTRDGSVWAWGANDHGQLGLGDTQPRLRPVRVAGLSNVRTVVGYYQGYFAGSSQSRV